MESTKCPSCKQDYAQYMREPFLLFCGHGFCQLCLNDSIQMSPNPQCVTCPDCGEKDLKYQLNITLIQQFLENKTPSYIKHLAPPPVSAYSELANGSYLIKSKHSGKYLGIRGASKLKGVGVVQNEKSQELHDVFRFYKNGDSYLIIPQHSMLYLQISPDLVDVPLAPIIQGEFSGEEHQFWNLEKQEDGCFFITNKKSNMCFDVDLVKKENGTPIIQYAQKSLDKAQNQLFTLVPAVGQ